MALVKLGGAVAAASGSLGGTVFSRNKAGAYVRNRSIPINPSSSRQQQVRFAMAQLTTRWVETLTAAQRAAWEVYSQNVLINNPLGEPREIGAIAHYCRSNVPRLSNPISPDPVVDDAPTIFDVGTFTEPVASGLSESTQQFSWAFTNTDDWANEDDSSMLVYASPPQNPSVNYYRGPYASCAKISGNSVTPPTSPVAITAPYPVVQGQKVFIRCNVTREDGRLSSSFRTSVTCGA